MSDPNVHYDCRKCQWFVDVICTEYPDLKTQSCTKLSNKEDCDYKRRQTMGEASYSVKIDGTVYAQYMTLDTALTVAGALMDKYNREATMEVTICRKTLGVYEEDEDDG